MLRIGASGSVAVLSRREYELERRRCSYGLQLIMQLLCGRFVTAFAVSG